MESLKIYWATSDLVRMGTTFVGTLCFKDNHVWCAKSLKTFHRLCVAIVNVTLKFVYIGEGTAGPRFWAFSFSDF